jgi:GNAT superfamily N-acetyltransferase
MDFHIDLQVKSGSQFNPSTREKVASIIEQIVEEDPSYWPYGCPPDVFEDLYLIRKEASQEPVGFVGWQVCLEKEGSVGYYAIGILPEHRRHGYARQAVKEVISKCSHTVDRVRAFIMPHNRPSQELAKSIGVPIVYKQAGNAVVRALPTVLGGAGTAGVLDAIAYGKDPKQYTSDFNLARLGNFGLNAFLGGYGTKLLGAGNLGGGAMIASAPAKDLMIAGQPAVTSASRALDAAADHLNKPQIDPKALAMILGGGLLGGAGLYGANMLRKAILNNGNARAGGRVKVTLPTRRQGDAETSVDLPVADVNLSNNLMGAISRDTRRRLREETKGRSWVRGPNGRLLTNGETIPVEELDVAKAAAILTA